MLENIVAGMSMVLRLDNILASMFGVTVGITMGAIPGLSDITAICLLLPFTFYLKPIAAIAMLMGLSKGGNFGGSIPAILFITLRKVVNGSRITYIYIYTPRKPRSSRLWD